jgi:hypothetical protein
MRNGFIVKFGSSEKFLPIEFDPDQFIPPLYRATQTDIRKVVAREMSRVLMDVPENTV